MVKLGGEVTFDGDPVVQGIISFFPADGHGASAEAVITDGNYSVSMSPGKKDVVIHGYKKVGERFPWGKDAPAAPILKEILPREFNDDSKLNIDADRSRTDLDFGLTSEPTADSPE